MASPRIFACTLALAAIAGATNPASAQTPPDASHTAHAGAAWTDAIRAAIISDETLLTLAPADATAFCPNFANLGPDGRLQFWTYLMTQLANEESGGDPNRTHWNAFDLAMHRPTFRRGLYQISIEAAHSRRYQCEVAATGDLTAPDVNAACAVKILQENVYASGAIAGAHYWPTLAHADRRAKLVAQVAASVPCVDNVEPQE